MVNKRITAISACLARSLGKSTIGMANFSDEKVINSK